MTSSCLPLKKTLLTSLAAYPYFETLTKTFLASTGLHSWKQEDIFARGNPKISHLSQYKRSFIGQQHEKSISFSKI